MAQFVGCTGAALGSLLFGALHDAIAGWTALLPLLIGTSMLVIVLTRLAGKARPTGA